MPEFVIELSQDFIVSLAIREKRLQLRDRASTEWSIR
jgi:hypothetical protein